MVLSELSSERSRSRCLFRIYTYTGFRDGLRLREPPSVRHLDGAYSVHQQKQPTKQTSTVRGKLRQRTVSLYRSMSYGLFCPGTI